MEIIDTIQDSGEIEEVDDTACAVGDPSKALKFESYALAVCRLPECIKGEYSARWYPDIASLVIWVREQVALYGTGSEECSLHCEDDLLSCKRFINAWEPALTEDTEADPTEATNATECGQST